jgi:hypothetical protein
MSFVVSVSSGLLEIEFDKLVIAIPVPPYRLIGIDGNVAAVAGALVNVQ